MSFADDLAALCSRELPMARENSRRGAEMIERLAHSLGMTIAVIAKGNGTTTEKLLTGAENQIAMAAADNAALGMLLAAHKRPPA